MANLNKVMFIGNLTRDVEMRTTNTGFVIGNTGIALNRKWRNASGEQREEVCFVDIQMWGKQAEAAGQYLKKGSPVFIEGHLKLDQWTDKNTGAKRQKLYVVTERMQFLQSRQQAGQGQQGGQAQAARPYVRQPAAHTEPQDAPQQFDTLDPVDAPPAAEEPVGDTPF